MNLFRSLNNEKRLGEKLKQKLSPRPRRLVSYEERLCNERLKIFIVSVVCSLSLMFDFFRPPYSLCGVFYF